MDLKFHTMFFRYSYSGKIEVIIMHLLVQARNPDPLPTKADEKLLWILAGSWSRL